MCNWCQIKSHSDIILSGELREGWLNNIKPLHELDGLIINSSFMRSRDAKSLFEKFVFMMQFNRGCFVVFWNACHWCTQNFKAMMIDQFYMMDLGKANRVISMEIFWLIPRHLMSVRRIEYTGLLSSASDTRIWFAWCTSVPVNIILLGVESLILLTSTAVLDLKFIISQFKKEMFPPWLIAVIWLNSWDNVSALDTGRFYSKKLMTAPWSSHL